MRQANVKYPFLRVGGFLFCRIGYSGMRIGIVAQQDNPRAASLAGDIRRSVSREVVVDETTAESLDTSGVPVEAMSECDLVVSIGGDGTFLYAVRGIDETPIMGVNLGEVGFLNATAPENSVTVVKQTISELDAGTVQMREMPRLTATGDDWTLPPALNEVVVMGQQRGQGNGVAIEVRVNGSLYTGGHADGVLVATPTGSTAYNLSEGGPLVHPDASGIVVNEMCATEGMVPLLVEANSEVSVRVDGPEPAVAVSDGRVNREIDPPAEVTISTTDPPIRIAGPDIDFFAALGKLE
jgi:NAD+ kinase